MLKIRGKNAGLNIDWILFGSLLPLLAAGLITMSSFAGEGYFFERQIIWIGISLVAFFVCSSIDWRFLRKSNVLVILYAIGLVVLSFLFLTAQIKGAKSWFNIAGVSIQPADFMKIVVILILAKYFSRRHVEIAHLRHIIVSGVYVFIPFILVLIQPDLGSAMIIFSLWLGLVIVSGIPKKYLLAVFLLLAAAFSLAWFFVFADYQKQRIMTFVDPMSDISGAGYNAFQSKVAVGSGELWGKGVGYGTQSRLSFLPEYETDFIFAAFAEEWGFLGVVLLFLLFGIVIWRILRSAELGATNFETLFALGVAVMLMSNFIIHVGMNIGVLPVTGLPLPFLSYGGSHLLTEFIALGMIMGMRRYQLAYHREDVHNEFVGPQ